MVPIVKNILERGEWTPVLLFLGFSMAMKVVETVGLQLRTRLGSVLTDIRSGWLH